MTRLRMRLQDFTLSLTGVLLTTGFVVGCGSSSATDQGVVVITEPQKLSTRAATEVVQASAESPARASEPAAPADTEESAAPAGGSAEGWGTLKGRVVFNGQIPQVELLVTKGSNVKDANVCAVEDIPSEKLVVDPVSKGVRHALVYLPRPSAVHPGAMAEATSAQIEFDQKQCVFIPHVLAAVKGAKILVKSSDQAGHNVHSLLRGTSFNQGIQPGSSITVEIKNAEGRPGQVVCDIHPWMKAWWLTLNNPYFAVTDEKGEFEIQNVPAGEQKVVVWAEALHPGFVTSSGTGDPVSIRPGSETVVEYTVDAAKVK